MSQKKFVSAVGIFSMAVLLCVCVFSVGNVRAAKTKKEIKTLKIGVLACLTGFFSVNDVPDVDATKIAAQIINKDGGITVKGQKYRVKLIFSDGQSTFDGMAAAANDLVYNKGVKFIIGPGGPFAGPASPITNSNKVIDVLNFCTKQPGQLGKTTPYTFLAYDSSVGDFYAGADYIKKHFPAVKEVVVVNSDDGALPYLRPIYKKTLADAGIKMIGLVSFPNQTVDFNPIAARIESFSKADAIVLGNATPPAAGGIVKALRDSGDNKLIIQPVMSWMQAVVNIAGKDAVKNVYIDSITPGAPNNPPLMNLIAKKVLAKDGPNTPISLMNGNCLLILKQAIEAAQSLNPTVVKAQWEKMDKVNTIFGPGRMCGDKTYGIRNHAVCHAIPFATFKNGKVVFAGWSSPIYVP